MTRSWIITLLFVACSFPEPLRSEMDAGSTQGQPDAAQSDGAVETDMATLTVTRVGSGTVQSAPAGITCDPDCTATFLAGTSITLTATAAQGNTLAGWTGCSGSSSCTFVLATSRTVSATFEPFASPPARSSHNMVWDSIRKRAIMFGGGDTNGARRDIWEWDGNHWTERTKASGGPAGRWDFGMAFDASRNRVVVFGGLTGSNAYNGETWEWDPTSGDWTNKTPASGPSARAYMHMTYDPNRQRTLLFGGYAPTGHLGDTWEWDGSTWTNRAPATAPAARALGFMTYDTTRARALLFGGYGGGNRNDTWEWDGNTWTDRTPATTKPAVRNTFQIVHDPVRQVTLLYGGYPPTGPVYADTWLWNGATQTWTNPTPMPNPGPLVGHAMVFDTERKRVMVFGGGGGPALSADTWEWDGATWTKR